MDDVSPGKHLGRLEILSLVQNGNSGQLFLARDTRDEKEVGVRVLPLENGLELRFGERHYTVARLKHKNILAVRKLASKPGISYVVTEAIHGISLRSALKQGPLPVPQFVDIARQIAAGLEAGHAAGLVHGSLHPESIFISPESVQIVDYGFNRPTPFPASSSSKKGHDSIEYLSPEQLKGEPPTERSDLFSLGAILYEMLVGHKAFRGQTPEERTRAVLEGMPEEPPARVPPALVSLLERLLPVDPANRLPSSAELRVELEQIEAELAEAQPPELEPPSKAHVRTRRAFPLARLRPHALALTLGGLLALLLGWSGAKFYTLLKNSREIPRFTQVTRRRGSIVRARFAGDGKTVVYTAQFEGGTLATYAKTPEDSDGRDLELPAGSTLMAVSKQGDLAVRLSNGTLARIPLAGGSREDLASGVLDADWAPDGKRLAIARYQGPGVPFRIEFPIGNVLHENRTPPEVIRVSPDGNEVAFTYYDGKKRELWVSRASGPARKLLTLDPGEAKRGLSWSPNGREIWFGSMAPQERGSIFGVNLSGDRRKVNWLPETYLDDVSQDRALLESLKTWSGVLVAPVDPERSKARSMDLSWHGETVNLFLTSSGAAIFTEYGEHNGPNYGIYTRENPASDAVRVGDGEAVAVSPDGRWVCALRPGPEAQYVLLPVANPADTKPIEIEKLQDKSAPIVGWLANGDYLVWGSEPGLRPRHWVWSPLEEELRPVTPEGSPLGYISDDGEQILTSGSDRLPHVFTTSTGASRLVSGLQRSDRPLRWSHDHKSIYVTALEGDKRFVLLLVNLATGARTRIKELQPDIQADTVIPRAVTPDGKSVAYAYYRTQSDLFEATGLK